LTALLVVLAVIAFFVILSLLRVGVIAEYSEDGFDLRAIAGPVRIQLVPGKEKDESAKKEKKKTKPKKKAKKPSAAADDKAKKEKKGGPVKIIKAVLPTALQTVGRFFKHLKINVLTIRYALTADDPYDVAMRYGYASGALGYICPILDRNFKIKKWDVNVYPCFTEPEESMYIKAKATIAIWELIYIVLKLDFKAIFSIL